MAERTASEIRRLSPSEAWGIYVGEQTADDFMSGYPYDDQPCNDDIARGTACRDYVNGSPLCADLDTDARSELYDHLYAYLTQPE